MRNLIVKCGVIVSYALISQILCQAAPSSDISENQKTLKHCAELLRSSIDTNQIELVCSRIITNLPPIIRLENQATKDGPVAITLVTNEDLVSQLKHFSISVRYNLNKLADQLTASNINTFSSELGYCAAISSPEGNVFYNLWSENGPVKYCNMRSDAGSVIMSAQCYENGKLINYRENISNNERFIFDANGKLTGYNWLTKNRIEVDVDIDDAGNAKIRGFNLNK